MCLLMVVGCLESLELSCVQIRLRAAYMYAFCFVLFWVTTQAKYVQRKMEALSHVHCCLGKAVCISYSDCVCLALVIRNAKCMHRILLSSVAYLLPTHFSTLSHKG